jgi:hypothetical protein
MSHTSLGDLLRAKLDSVEPDQSFANLFREAAEIPAHKPDGGFISTDFLAYETGLLDAITYCDKRKDDATKLASVFKWEPHPHLDGVLRTEMYGLSVLWDVFGGVLHAGNPPGYEFISRAALHHGHEDPEFVTDFRQLVAYVLARYW